MTNPSIAERLGEDFLTRALHRDYRHVSQAVDAAGLMTWDDLDRILTQHRLDPPRLRLSREGQTLLLPDYATPVSTCRHTVWHRLQPAGLHPLLADGASWPWTAPTSSTNPWPGSPRTWSARSGPT
ncbi:hypothetical protein [Streptomyces sp. NPDC056323]|uniref:hypothetical protein n=1 Tax=unclassified Streptomyces TaxID=2593676 RepID=UPI0035D8271A